MNRIEEIAYFPAGIPSQAYFHGPSHLLFGGVPAFVSALLAAVFLLLPVFSANSGTTRQRHSARTNLTTLLQKCRNIGNFLPKVISKQSRFAELTDNRPSDSPRTWPQYLKLRFGSQSLVVVTKGLVAMMWVIFTVRWLAMRM